MAEIEGENESLDTKITCTCWWLTVSCSHKISNGEEGREIFYTFLIIIRRSSTRNNLKYMIPQGTIFFKATTSTTTLIYQ